MIQPTLQTVAVYQEIPGDGPITTIVFATSEAAYEYVHARLAERYPTVPQTGDPDSDLAALLAAWQADTEFVWSVEEGCLIYLSAAAARSDAPRRPTSRRLN